MTGIKIIDNPPNIIKIYIPKDENLVKKIRSIKERKWNNDGKYWTIPRRIAKIQKLLELFSEDNIQIPKSLQNIIDESIFLPGKNERREGTYDRRKMLRSPFTERRKRSFLEVYKYELNKLFITKQEKNQLLKQIQIFIKKCKYSPRKIKTEDLELYLSALKQKYRSDAAKAFQFLYCTLYGFNEYDTTFIQYEIDLKPKISYTNLLKILIRELRYRNYSLKTVKMYKNCLIRLFNFYKDKKPEDITTTDVKKYIMYKKDNETLSASYQSNIISSYKFLFKNILNKKVTIEKLRYPKKPKKLPKVLSSKEVITFFKNEDSLNLWE